ncbi:plasmid pRiA4b ORF-3 family protein [Nocardia sp. NPDC050799]|uniref:plasmid pRiA4b ORF-3 family protein n=1 Tax=Nocardia sp. NPDC050799 TaxID=3154842 RepID=UPI0033C3B006
MNDLSDAFDAEIAGAALLSGIAVMVGDGAEDALREHLVPGIESVGTVDAAGMLAVIATLAEPGVADIAAAGMDRLRGAGITGPAWVGELCLPSTVCECRALRDRAGDTFVLAARFDRVGTSVGVLVLIEPDHCGAAAEIAFTDAFSLSEALVEVAAMARADGIDLVEYALDAAEFRWEAEVALDARDVHERDDRELAGPDELPADPDDGSGPLPYRLAAPILRARLRALPQLDKPKPPHAERSPDDVLTVLSELAAADRGAGFDFLPSRRRPRPAKLPPKRKTRNGRAPILRLRVDLRGARPPIWRRLEVPGDITLRALHNVIQVAFGWQDSHLYMFETDYGTFGRPDPELGTRSDKKVTLEQVAYVPGDRVTYLYDFGDNWQHTIAVEKSLPADASVTYPRCTGGRRAAPPEDCGGMGGYEYSLEVLADPNHEDHQDQLEWLGLDSPDDFDPVAFDKDTVNVALAQLR